MTNFPPSFDGSPWSYGFALFSLTLISAFALAQLLSQLFEYRRAREIERAINNALPPPLPLPKPNLLSTYRHIVAGLMLTIVCGAAPDVVFLMAWGEATAGSMDIILLIDRIGDGLTVLPFLWAIWSLAWAAQSLPQSMAFRAAQIPMVKPRLPLFRDKLKIAAIVLVIAVGVTIGKASA